MRKDRESFSKEERDYLDILINFLNCQEKEWKGKTLLTTSFLGPPRGGMQDQAAVCGVPGLKEEPCSGGQGHWYDAGAQLCFFFNFYYFM